MQLAGSLPQQTRCFEMRANQYGHCFRHGHRIKANRRTFARRGRTRLVGCCANSFEIAAQRRDRIFPCVPGFRQKTRQESDREFFAVSSPVFQCPGDRRDSRKSLFGKKSAELKIRIWTWLHPGKDLEKILVTNDERSIALLNPAD